MKYTRPSAFCPACKEVLNPTIVDINQIQAHYWWHKLEQLAAPKKGKL